MSDLHLDFGIFDGSESGAELLAHDASLTGAVHLNPEPSLEQILDRWDAPAQPALVSTPKYISAVRLMSSCFQRLQLAPVLPEFSSLSTAEISAVAHVFLIRVVNKNLLKDSVKSFVNHYFATVDVIRNRDSVNLVHESIIKRWHKLLGFPATDSASNRLESLTAILVGRVAESSEIFCSGDAAILRILRSRGLITENEPLNLSKHAPLLLDCRPTVAELGPLGLSWCPSFSAVNPVQLVATVQPPLIVRQPHSASIAFPKQPVLAAESPSFSHSNFVQCQPSEIPEGALLAVLNSSGNPVRILQFRLNALWEQCSSVPIFNSISVPVYLLTAQGIINAAKSNKNSWPLTPVPPPLPALNESFSWPGETSGTLSNPINLDIPTVLTFKANDFVYGSEHVATSQTAKDRQLASAPFTQLVKDQIGRAEHILGPSLNVDGKFVGPKTRNLIPERSFHLLEFLLSKSLLFFINFCYALDFDPDMSIFGGFNLIHCLPSGVNSFRDISHLRETWEVWAYCYDHVVCISPEIGLFVPLLRPLFDRMSRASKGLADLKSFDVRFIQECVDNIMGALSTVVHSSQARTESWLRPRYQAEFFKVAVWPVDLDSKYAEFQRTKETRLRSLPASQLSGKRLSGVDSTNLRVSKVSKVNSLSSTVRNAPQPVNKISNEICRGHLLLQLGVKSTG